MSAEVLDLEELSAEDEMALKGRSKKPIFGYYKLPDGTITVNVTSPAERMAFMEEGWRYMPEYGAFDHTTEYSTNHPFECLFMYGGAAAMTKEQIIELGYNIHPPLIPRCKQPISPTHKKHNSRCMPARPVEFPQLEEGDRVSYPCRNDTCSRSLEENAFPTEAGRNQHESVMHSDEKSDIRTGDAIANGIAVGLAEALSKFMQPQSNAVVLTEEQIAVLKEKGLLK